jgi:hypothetical protein
MTFGQTYARFGGHTLLSIVQMYGGTTGRTLCKPYRWMYVGLSDVRYFLKYSLVNTYMYETTFGPLGKNHLMYAPLAGRLLLFGHINTPYPLQVLDKFQTPPGCQSVPRVI